MIIYINPAFIEPLDGLKLNFELNNDAVLKSGGRRNVNIVKGGGGGGGGNNVTAVVHRSLSGPRVVMKGNIVLI